LLLKRDTYNADAAEIGGNAQIAVIARGHGERAISTSPRYGRNAPTAGVRSTGPGSGRQLSTFWLSLIGRALRSVQPEASQVQEIDARGSQRLALRPMKIPRRLSVQTVRRLVGVA
jgi:hypothetical protein